jgi:predicted nuclease of predicted toxin-antitoxin system
LLALGELDENLPARLTGLFRELGHQVDTVVQEGLQGVDDERLWPAVQAAARFLLTKDLGFADARRYPPGTHHGILVLRLSDDRSSAVLERLAALLGTESIEGWAGCLVIVTDHKVRVRRP